MWFIRRWVVTYLAVQETYYSELSLALVAAFGEGKKILDNLIINNNIYIKILYRYRRCTVDG